MAYRNGESISTHPQHGAICRPKPIRGRRFPPEVLTPIEVAAMLSACSSRPTGVRNRAMLVMLYHRAGLRINEALSLLPKDLDPIGGAIRI